VALAVNKREEIYFKDEKFYNRTEKRKVTREREAKSALVDMMR
jgi:hypothetical protein